ncbi:MAG: nuclease-related domain-containing protein [Akkermansiaceae bacterium]
MITPFLWIGVLILFGVVTTYLTPYFKSWLGAYMVEKNFGKLPDNYRQWHKIEFDRGGGRIVKIDHLVASRQGVFIVQNVDCEGVVSGCEKSNAWKQRQGGKSNSFPNPLRLGENQIACLVERSQLRTKQFHNVVILTGEIQLSSELPENVITAGFSKYLLGHKNLIISEQELDEFCKMMDASLSCVDSDAKVACASG